LLSLHCGLEMGPLPSCKQRLTAVAWGRWCLLSSLLSRGKKLKRIKLVSKERNEHVRVHCIGLLAVVRS